jgi:hypothetical protein
VEISYSQILFLDSLILCENKNKIWPYEISTQSSGISSLKVAELGKILYIASSIRYLKPQSIIRNFKKASHEFKIIYLF